MANDQIDNVANRQKADAASEAAQEDAAERERVRMSAARQDYLRELGPAITVSEDGSAIQMKTIIPKELLFSPFGTVLFVVTVVTLICCAGLAYYAISLSSGLDSLPTSENRINPISSLLAIPALFTPFALWMWLRLGHRRPVGVRVTESENAGILKGRRTVGVCAASEVKFKVIQLATSWPGRERWVGKCTIDAPINTKVYLKNVRIFGMSEDDVTTLRRFAAKHRMKVYVEKFGSTGGSERSYTDKGMFST